MSASISLLAWPTKQTIHGILKIDSASKSTCHGRTKRSTRCRKAISQDNSDKILELLDEVVQLKSWAAARSHLNQVAQLIMCKQFHRDQDCEWLERWQRILEPLTEAIGAHTENAEEGEDLTSTPGHHPENDIVVKEEETSSDAEMVSETHLAPDDALCEDYFPDYSLQHREAEEDKPSRRASSSAPSEVPLSPSSRALKDTGPCHKFKQFGKARSITSLNTNIKNLLLRSLTPEEAKSDGKIYIYTFPANYRDSCPYLKIGYSADLKESMAQWRRQCGYEPRVLTDSGAECYIKVEKLVHQQLWNQRKREIGCPCGTKHQEWFNVTWVDAAACVALWADWMRQEPYNEDRMMRDEWKARLEEVDLSDPQCWNIFVNGEKCDDSGYGTASEDEA